MPLNDPFDTVSYYALALDPVHVGTGGYRLSEVDLTILREPGTHLPKIPGSSLEGTARAFTAMRHTETCRRYDTENSRYASCAGKGGPNGDEHCGKPNCPVCVPYGFTRGSDKRSFHGLAQFYDARILFFPVHSLAGPVWVTCPTLLKEAGWGMPEAQLPQPEQVRVSSSLAAKPTDLAQGINLGWLFLPVCGKDLDTADIKTKLGLPGDFAPVLQRLVVAPDDLFDQIVNSNLEVRTSVSIDPETGAAEDNALFTYEAMPRSTVLRFQIAYLNPKQFGFPETNGTYKILDHDTTWVKKRVHEGMALMQHLGVGGMNTRGFGRLRIMEKGGTVL